MADLDAYYQVLCKGQKDYHGGHFANSCALEKDLLLKTYNPKEKSDQVHDPVLPSLPTEIIDLILFQCDAVDAACLSLTSKRFHAIYVRRHGPYPSLHAACPDHVFQDFALSETADAWFHRRCTFHSRITSVRKLDRTELMPSDLYYCRPCAKFHGPVTGKINLYRHDVPPELPPGWVIRRRQGRYPEAVIRRSLFGRVKEWATN